MESIQPMLAKKHTKEDPTGWWMSEKLDGVRAIWDGKNFISRNGTIFNAPDWFIKNMPKELLDGELWEDRGCFQETVGKVRAHNGDWSKMKYMIFDLVTDLKFEERLETLKQLDIPSHCRIVHQEKCKNASHLKKFENEIIDISGEGVMLRKAGSRYEQRRSDCLLKVKKNKTDEAVVVDHFPGKGKYVGKLGALVCEYKGKIFKIGTGLSDKLRECPPAIGSLITFSFFETTKAGVPRFPTFCAVRDYE